MTHLVPFCLSHAFHQGLNAVLETQNKLRDVGVTTFQNWFRESEQTLYYILPTVQQHNEYGYTHKHTAWILVLDPT